MSYLSFWQENCSMEQIIRWCGDHNIAYKKEIRKYIKNKNYESVLDCGAAVFSEYYGFKEDKIDIKYTATEITKKFIDLGIER